jgi:hypothetical protein
MDFPRGFPLPPRASRRGGGDVAESRKSVDIRGNTSHWFTLTHPVISLSVNESALVSSNLACFNFQVLSQENNSLKKNGFKKEEELK